MSNIIDKIQLSGVTYDIGGQGGSGVSVVEITQSDYDNLPSSAKTDTSKMYVITDAEAGDLTNYYTKTETNTLLGGKADTATTYTKTEVDNAITAATSTKQDTLVSGTNIKTINNISILGSGNIDIQGGGGGGKAIAGGRGISVTTGATADTVSFNLPISAGTGTNSLVIASDNYDLNNRATKIGAVALNGADIHPTYATGSNSLAEGADTKAAGWASHAEGAYTTASTDYSHAEGSFTVTSGKSSHAEGHFTKTNNNSEHASGQFNVSNKANNTWGDSGNTLFSVGNGTSSSARHNAFEIRQNGDIYLTSGSTDIKLQDHLGGGGGGGSSYTAGDGIDITNNVISVTGKVDTSTYTAYTASTDAALASKVDTTTYNTYTAATDAALALKQTTLTAGTGISIIDNVISATGGGGGKAVTGGTNISVVTGETADTINCTLPMSTDSVKKIVVDSNYSSFVTSDAVFTADSLSNSILLGNNTFKIKGIIKGKIKNNLIIGSNNTSQLRNGTSPTLEGNLVVGSNNQINSSYSLTVGNNNIISRGYQFAIGYNQNLSNEYEISLGAYNVSSSGSSTFGDSGNTLFSIGNGTSSSARHNAFEIRQNGDIYCSDGTNDVKLQDTITATASNTTALGGLKLVKLTQSSYDALSPNYDSNTLYVIVN